MLITKKTHFEKLKATLDNDKLPVSDKKRVELAIEKYNEWVSKIEKAKTDLDGNILLIELVKLLNDYKYFIEFELIFNSKDDFLYRQKGQLKLDNSIIEEFLPHVINEKLLPELKNSDFEIGPNTTFSSVYFESTISNLLPDGGFRIRTKDQDFSISKKLYVQTSFDETFKNANPKFTYLSYIAAECKTNLDKTMFQEASATAHDIKSAIPGSKYFLLCEWLDMTPVSTAPTDIDEVIILRKAKRLSSNIRSEFNSYEGRKKNSKKYSDYLQKNPVYTETIARFLFHIQKLAQNESLVEDDVLKIGYF